MGATKTLLPGVFIHMLQLLDLLVILKDNDSTPSYWSKNKKQNNKKFKKKKNRKMFKLFSINFKLSLSLKLLLLNFFLIIIQLLLNRL